MKRGNTRSLEGLHKHCHRVRYYHQRFMKLTAILALACIARVKFNTLLLIPIVISMTDKTRASCQYLSHFTDSHIPVLTWILEPV